ncbi:unnamed protein product [Ectocarpus sp. 13 AM-2016]
MPPLARCSSLRTRKKLLACWRTSTTSTSTRPTTRTGFPIRRARRIPPSRQRRSPKLPLPSPTRRANPRHRLVLQSPSDDRIRSSRARPAAPQMPLHDGRVVHNRWPLVPHVNYGRGADDLTTVADVDVGEAR